MKSITPKLILFLLVGISIQLFAQSQPGGYDQNWSNYPAGEFGPVNINFDYSGVRSIAQVPAVGVHPRVYISPSEVPDMINRVQTTASGQEAFKQMHAYTTLLHFGYNPGNYNHNSSYGSDSYGNRRVDNAGKWNMNPRYSKLLANDPTAFDNTTNTNKDRYLLASVMALEALECLIMAGQIDPDTGLAYNTRATMLANAMAYWAQLVIGDPNLNWNNYHFFGGVHMALAYDFNYNNMTTAQRDLVRQALAATVPPNPRYGSETHYYAVASNWVGLNSFEVLTNWAIEGEAGYNTTLTEEYMRAYRNFLTYGWYASGTPLEGLGKNYQFVTSLIAAAKRGYSLLGHPHVRTFGNDYLPAITQPYGYSVQGTDVWGGTGWDAEVGGWKNNPSDILGLKYAFPNDQGIDFAWRNYIEKWYSNSSENYVYQSIEPATSGYHNYLVMAVLFAQDYNSGSFAAQNQAALGGESYFAPERGMAVMRSGYDEDALMTHFHCRQDLGGHTNGDRNNFTLSALGRNWIRYTYGSAFQETEYHSCLLVDDMGIFVTQKDGNKARQPGKVLNFSDTGPLAQITGDATYAYSWEWHWETRSASQDHSWLGTNNWTKVTETWNDFRYVPGTEVYHNIPWYDFGHWNTPFMLERMIKRPYNPMQRVYRTMGLVRCERPYMLIIDDIQKDNDVHNYKWLAQTANDLVISGTDVNIADNDYRCDVIMSEPNGNRKLLVRVLNNEGYTGGVPAILETLTPGINGVSPITRLVVEANVVAPDFKVLIYPYTDGDPLPVTNWNPNHDELWVTLDGESKIFEFDKNNGLTNLNLKYSFCNNELDLTDTDLLVNGYFHVSDWIRTNEPIGGNTIFKAGNYIEMNEGFDTGNGLQFDAIIEGCN